MTSAGERLFGPLSEHWARLQALGPQVLAINAGLTLAVIIGGWLVL